ncbi:uncharacterized protein EV420DRAFT_1070911 [Desarmillaria tabescens]|uniref:Uncharacterized protein n=1 Tax=Armillaria tabescens TaxID=1929756 RepID=A0AA39MR51_ARMTA|nr:uncharacterized protein EV420DRAFT_1070911 [Desarmillaria tabescens]KAK0442775.1 hypothetical protein EV420DRAFT_1070911 [Desarmillaria tabescens]
MSFSSSTIILFLSALFSTASPLGSRDPTPGCHPNFGGVALTLSTPSGALSWSAKPVLNDPLSASSSSSSKFFFQQNGFPIVDYTVKTVENNNFAVQLGAGGAPLMANTDPSGSNPYALVSRLVSSFFNDLCTTPHICKESEMDG